LINSVKNTENKHLEIFMLLIKVQILFEKELTLLKNITISCENVYFYAIHDQNAFTSNARMTRG
jgi:hypothetical protein